MLVSSNGRLLMTIIVIALSCAIVGGIMLAVGFARRGARPRNGAIMGAVLGASIGLMVAGLLDIAANPGSDQISGRLLGIASVGLGLVLLLLLRLFGPRQNSKSTKSAGDFSQINIPIPKLKHSADRDEQPALSKKIFLSYRREDSADATGRIYDHLAQRYDKKSIFKDVDSIPFGVDFRKHLRTVIETCEVVLVVIGDRWLTVQDATGQRRLDDPADFVRIEVEAALQRDIPIVPILINGATMPRAEELPVTLQELAYRNGLAVRHDPDFHNDLDRLTKSLEQN